LEKGQSVVCLLGSANRDPAIYRDPDRLDVTRRDVRPLSFGGGIHYCIGAQLALIEGEIAIATLLRRLPKLRIDDIDYPDWRQTFCLVAASISYRLVGRSNPRPGRWQMLATRGKY
jgi:cytochrome P450